MRLLDLFCGAGGASQFSVKLYFYGSLLLVFFGLLGGLLTGYAFYRKRHLLGAALILGGWFLCGSSVLLFQRVNRCNVTWSLIF